MGRRVWVILAIAIALGGILVVGAGTTSVLVVTDENGGEMFAVPVQERSEVTVEYTHSVERSLVTEVYVVSDGELVLDRMLFSSFGAGLPADATVSQAGDRYVYAPPEQRHDILVVSTGEVAGHELHVDGERFDLVELSDGGTVSIHIEDRFGG